MNPADLGQPTGERLHPLVALIRRWAVEWLAAARPEVCPEILADGYSIHIGGHTLAGREAYIEGTLAQLDRFPGLGISVHELICSDEKVALRFSEHGAAARLGGREAAWGGIALFGWDGARLTGCHAEEDYLSRRRQLDTGRCDAVEAPAAAPWNVVPRESSPSGEAIVREWLSEGDLSAVVLDDGWLGHEAPVLLYEAQVQLDAIFSAGDAVAFHGRQDGRYAGGLPGVTARAGTAGGHHLAGIVRVDDGCVTSGRIVRDRLGFSRALARVS